MTKKSKPAARADKSKGGPTAEEHRKMAAEFHAKARLHDAKADVIDAKNPPKAPKYGSRGYPC